MTHFVYVYITYLSCTLITVKDETHTVFSVGLCNLILGQLFIRCNGKRGWFPSNYVQIIPEDPNNNHRSNDIINDPSYLKVNISILHGVTYLQIITTMIITIKHMNVFPHSLNLIRFYFFSTPPILILPLHFF